MLINRKRGIPPDKSSQGPVDKAIPVFRINLASAGSVGVLTRFKFENEIASRELTY